MSRWVHLPCRNTPAREGNFVACLICRKPIADGEATKKLNRGGRHGVRHLACGQSIGDCPYVVDLTGPLDTEAPSATRNEDLFPTESSRSRKSSAPLCAVPVSCMDDGMTMRDPRLKRDRTNDR